MIKVSKLWGDGKFQNLTTETKLFYLYLSSHPFISSLGIVCIDLPNIESQLRYSTDLTRTSSKELVDKDYIKVFKVGDLLYFVVLGHLNTLSNSQTTLTRIKKEFEELSEELKLKLSKVNITKQSVTKRFDSFSPPTPEEVENYAMSQGHLVNGNVFILHYQKVGGIWKDARGKRVLDWKAKVRKVWCKDENKIPLGKNAPKEYEYFFVKVEEKFIFATHWVNNEPRSREGLFGDTKLLEKLRSIRDKE